MRTRNLMLCWLPAVWIAAAATSAAAQGLPILDIGPKKTVLLPAGKTFQFEAHWIYPPSPDPVPAEVSLVWMSSDPSVVSIDARGLATALKDDAYAVITVTTMEDFAHVPGVASVAVGAVRNAEARELPASYLLDHQVFPENTNYLQLTVQDNKATRQIQPGHVVLFGESGSIKVATVVPDLPGTLVLIGVSPSLPELFEELTIEMDAAAIQRVADALAATRGGDAAAEGEEGVEGGASCAFRITLQIDPEAELKLQVRDGKLVLMSLLIETGMSAALPSESLRTQVECSLEIYPRIPVLLLPIYGVLTLDVSSYVGIGAKLIFDAADTTQVESPSFSIGTLVRGLVHYDPEQGLSVPLFADEPSREASMGDVTFTDPLSTDFTLTAQVYGDVGFQARLYPLLVIPDVYGVVDKYALAKLTFFLHRFTLEHELNMPVTMFLGPEHPLYEGPWFVNSVIWDLYPIKQLGTGDVIGKFLKVIGIGNVAIDFPPINVLTASVNSQRPDLSVSPDPVYVTAPPGFPAVTSVVGTEVPTPWPLADRTTTLWARRSGEPSFAERWPVSAVGWDPEPGEEGAWEVRAVSATESGFGALFPFVSDVVPVTVLPGSAVQLTPPNPELVTGVGTTTSLQLFADNVAAGASTYEVHTPNPWLVIDPQGPITLQAGMRQIHDLTLDCNGLQPFPPITVNLELTVAGDPETKLFPARVGCTDFDAFPRSLWFSGEVSDPPVWMEKTFEVRNPGGATIDWQLVLPGPPIVVDPPSGTLAPGQSQTVEVRAQCTAAGTSSPDFVLDVPATGTGVPIFVTLECKDDGGGSAGDPHLVTFDGVRYDFQGAGEFVLSRDGAGDFEVQVRQAQWGSRAVAVNTAIAARVGGDRVAFYLQPAPGGGFLMVNGAAVDLQSGAVHDLPDGGTVSRAGGRYTVRWPGSTTYLNVTHGGGYLNLFLHPDAALAGLTGLLGDDDGDGTNDFRLRDGTPLPSPPSFADLYDCADGVCFAYGAQGWINLALAASLFDYAPGGGPGDYAHPAFPGEELTVEDLDPAVVAWAQGVCTAAGVLEPAALTACILDIGVTGDTAMGVANGELAGALPPEGPWGVYAYEWDFYCADPADTGCANAALVESTDVWSHDGRSVRFDSPALAGLPGATGQVALVWPLTRAAGLDLSGFASLWLRLKVDQEDPAAGLAAPLRLRFATAADRWVLLEADPLSVPLPDGAWVLLEVPLAGGSGWTRSEGNGDLSEVNWLAVELDQAGSAPFAVGLDHFAAAPPSGIGGMAADWEFTCENELGSCSQSSFADDTTPESLDGHSVRFQSVPDDGPWGDVFLSTPPGHDLGIDASAATYLELWLKVDQLEDPPAGWQDPLDVRLYTDSTHVMWYRATFEPRVDGVWVEIAIPLAGSADWQVMQSNGDLGEVNWIELMFDQWGSPPYRIWLDRIRFE